MKWEDIEKGVFVPANQIEKFTHQSGLGLLTIKESDSFEKKDATYFYTDEMGYKIDSVDVGVLAGYFITLNPDCFYMDWEERELRCEPYYSLEVKIDESEWSRKGNIQIINVGDDGDGGYWGWPHNSVANWDTGSEPYYLIGNPLPLEFEFMNWINENPFEVKS